MTDLSPAAQAVLYATHKAMAEQQTALSGVPDYRQVAAAALRAVANQVVPEGFADAYDCCLEIVAEIRDDILAIAAELEGAE